MPTRAKRRPPAGPRLDRADAPARIRLPRRRRRPVAAGRAVLVGAPAPRGIGAGLQRRVRDRRPAVLRLAAAPAVGRCADAAHAAVRPALARRAFPHRRPLGVLSRAWSNLGAAAASFYAIGYGRHESEPARVLPFFPAFLAAWISSLAADDAYTFLLSWELMSLASWALVMAHHREAANARAGYRLYPDGEFRRLRAAARLRPARGRRRRLRLRRDARASAHPPSSRRSGAWRSPFGAGSKAGLAPLHVWLPLAHPAAPSHVSALMSGVMTKVAVYGFIRIVFDLDRARRLVVGRAGAGRRRGNGGARRAASR